jgi:hypothetical protein
MLPASLWTALSGSAEVETLAGELWFSLITAVVQLLYSAETTGGVVFSHTLLKHPPLGMDVWTFTPRANLLLPRSDPAYRCEVVSLPSACDDFWLVLTAEFSLVAVLAPDEELCLLSWHPQSLKIGLEVLSSWLSANQRQKLLQIVQYYPPTLPNYKWLSRFSHIALQQAGQTRHWQPELSNWQPIQAIAHEVKTTLATIRTLTKSLLKRRDVIPDISDRLQAIEQECNSQIARFELVLQAVHLQENCQSLPCQAIGIGTLLHRNLSQWQAQAVQRQIALILAPLPELPLIHTNPQLLEQVINGLVDHLMRTSPFQAEIYLQLSLAGNYLKLQFQVDANHHSDTAQPIGDWLICHPDTGVVSLSIPTVKSLLQMLGGRLTVRSSLFGVHLTLFLPLSEALQ